MTSDFSGIFAPFFCQFFFFPFFSILFQCDSFINISWKCRFIKIRMLLSYHYRNQVRGGLTVKIGRHIIGAWAEMGQNRNRGGGGVKNCWKLSDIIYARSLNCTDIFSYFEFYQCRKNAFKTNGLIHMRDN